eukprot:1155237-Pelagomonas_calceolata.AAC.2
MRKWISSRACTRDPSISHAITGLVSLIFSNSICTFVTSNANMRFYFLETNIGLWVAHEIRYLLFAGEEASALSGSRHVTVYSNESIMVANIA